ncbi:MAG: AGE family epimerase/isomerase, partial [Opitutales bacterium]|nr:AGE family epimerase/isomerase [Opitutales bacterium]
DDGSWLSRDKWLWSQWRAIWVFSRLFNRFGQERKWLDHALHVYRFATRHGWDPQGQGWNLCLDGEGRVLRGLESIYVDGFAMYGLAELYRATGDEEVKAWLTQTADRVAERLKQPHEQIPHFPYPIAPGNRVHGIPMMFSLNFGEAALALGNERYADLSRSLSKEVLDHFYRPDRDLFLERIAVDGSELPAPEGTAVVPGHVIEDLWFQMYLDTELGDGRQLPFLRRQILRHFDLGWDSEFGGLFLAVDADARSQVAWSHADTKLWWPQTEALYALLLVHRQTGESPFADAYNQTLSYCLNHYPVPNHGEWLQKLNRQGQPIREVVALPVKDPFHLPRSLMLQCEELELKEVRG